jgi:hypothetical protein
MRIAVPHYTGMAEQFISAAGEMYLTIIMNYYLNYTTIKHK